MNNFGSPSRRPAVTAIYVLIRATEINLRCLDICEYRYRWPIPVKQIKVNENKFKLTKTHPRKRKHFPENGNNSQKTKTNSSKPKQIQVNENKFKLRNSSCGIVVDIFCLQCLPKVVGTPVQF